MSLYFNYTSHKDIDSNTAEYLCTIADASSVENIPLETINDFLNGQEIWFGMNENSFFS